jgi:tripartite-type tricarboxylate transporter receptor subunit TctC
MRTYWLIAAILGLLLAAGGAHAQQNYPTKPIRLIVAFPPGGGVDIVARLVAQKLTESLGTSVVVDNRPGAAGTIGTEAAVRANPDGYTMIVVEGAYAANPALYKLPYDPVDDVTAIALIGETGFVVTLHPSVPITSIRELIAYDKANPGKLNYGSGGAGSVNHLVPELFNQMAGTKLTHVPYKGIGLALNDLLGGQIHLIFGGMPPMIPQIKANRLRGIAVTTAKRSSALPDIPIVAETVPGYEAVQWFAVLGPKALPKDIVARWNKDIDRIVQLPDVKERMAGEGMEPVGGPPERFLEVLRRDIAKWQKVVKIGNIKPGS